MVVCIQSYFVRTGEKTMFRPTRILVPTDMSKHSDRAICQAFDIAGQFGSEVFLLHVIQNPVQQCTVDFCMDQNLRTFPRGKAVTASRSTR
jgi:hypothetical protein